MNIPNMLSLSRIALMPAVLFCLRKEQTVPLLILMLIAVASDYFDGYFARKKNQISSLGKILDPLADKICLNSMVLALSLWRGFPWWATGLIILRDVLILAGGFLMINKTKEIPVSNWPGKFAVTFLSAAIFFYVLNWQPWGLYLLYASLLLILVSGIIYLRKILGQSKRTPPLPLP
ncbi:MAG: CDP-alcohol phosphatidyltransferase family protein [Candidatus Edwardsbacteria bacterium]|nr:CDP-alcohol phosphatidyltransferase family protein [Candidatus Edwardsbacteria bacterium]